MKIHEFQAKRILRKYGVNVPDGQMVSNPDSIGPTFDELKAQSNDGDFTNDYGLKVYEKSGDLFLMDNSNYVVRRITNTLARESNPQLLHVASIPDSGVPRDTRSRPEPGSLNSFKLALVPRRPAGPVP